MSFAFNSYSKISAMCINLLSALWEYAAPGLTQSLFSGWGFCLGVTSSSVNFHFRACGSRKEWRLKWKSVLTLEKSLEVAFLKKKKEKKRNDTSSFYSALPFSQEKNGMNQVQGACPIDSRPSGKFVSDQAQRHMSASRQQMSSPGGLSLVSASSATKR